MPFIYKPTNREPMLPNYLLSWTHISNYYSCVLLTPRPGIRQLSTDHTPLRPPLKLFKQANPMPAYPALPIPFHPVRPHTSGSCPFPAPPATQSWPVPLRSPLMSPPQRCGGPPPPCTIAAGSQCPPGPFPPSCNFPRLFFSQ